MTETGETKPSNLLVITIARLRNRAWLLRFQAYGALCLIILLVLGLITIFSNYSPSSKKENIDVPKVHDPYDYSAMEHRHNQLSDKLTSLIEETSNLRQEVVSDNYVARGKRSRELIEAIDLRNSDLKKLKTELDERLSKDRANLSLEISKIQEERDQVIRDGIGKRDMVSLVGDVAFRLGTLVLALYLSSLLFSTSKYLLRVADHLNSIADSIDLSHAAGIGLEGAIRSLTPHPIDFHLDEAISIKTVKELMTLVKDSTPKEK